MSEDVHSRSKIKFDRTAGFGVVEEILTEVGKGLTSRVRYTITKTKEFDPTGRDMPETNSINIYGQVIVNTEIIKMGASLAVFEIYRDSRNMNSQTANGIKFQTIPGYELGKHPKGEVFVWDETRRIVKEYFERIRS